MANNAVEPERDALLFQFAKVYVRLKTDSSKLDRIILTEMAECKALFEQIRTLLKQDEELITAFEELEKRKLKVSQTFDIIRGAYNEFRVKLLSVWLSRVDICKKADGLRETAAKNETWIVELKAFLNGEERLKIAAEMTKAMKDWEQLKIKQKLNWCIAKLKAVLAEMSEDFVEIWSGVTIN